MYNWVPHILRSALLIVVNLCSLYWLDYGSSQCKDPKLIFSRKILFLKTKYSDQRKKRNKDNKKEREKGKKKTCYKEIYIYIYKFSNLSQTAVQWTLCTIKSMFWCKRQHAGFSNLCTHGFLLQIYLKFCCGEVNQVFDWCKAVSEKFLFLGKDYLGMTCSNCCS